jgi:aerobic C4-dicarboxylate transport protein
MPISGKPWYRILYIQVLIGVALGISIGAFFPEIGKSLKPLGDAFVKLVKMMIAPIIFCTVVHGIASMGDMKKLGRVGFKTLLYFEIVSTLALLIGLVVVNILKPGEGFNIDPATLDSSLTSGYVEKAKSHSMLDFFLNIIPTTIFSPFTNGDLLQVLFISILMAFTISFMGEKKPIILNVLETASKLFFGVMGIVVKFAPLGAFGAMGFTVGSYGLGALGKLLELMLGFYITSALFVFIVFIYHFS